MAGVADLLALPSQIAAAVGSAIGSFSMGSIAPRVGMVLQPMEQFVEKFVKSIKSILTPFEKLTEVANHFVTDFDPALVQDLGTKFRDLNATIGLVLRPITDVARGVVRSLSDYLLPAMKKMEPIVRELAEHVAVALKDGFKELAATLQELMPLFEGAKDVLIGLIDMLDDLRQVIAMVREIFKALVGELFTAMGLGGEGGGSIKDVMAQLRKAFQDLIVVVYKYMAALFTAIGWIKGLDALAKSLNRVDPEKGNSAGISTALNPMFKSISELGKSVQAAMFAASDVGAKDAKTDAQKANDFLADIKKAIEDGADKADEIKDWIRQGKELVDEIKVFVANGIEEIKNLPKTIKLGTENFAKDMEAKATAAVEKAIAGGVKKGIRGAVGLD